MAVLFTDQVLFSQLRCRLCVFGHQRQADVRFAQNVRRDIAVDVGTRRGVQVVLVTAKIIDAGRRPPESERVRVLARLFPIEKVTRLQRRLRRLKLLVRKICRRRPLVDLIVNGLDRGFRFFG